MRQSKLFYKTLKTTPKEAATASHKLLLRAGFIQQVAAGRYAFLPLGFRVWEKIIKVIDEEMKQLGSQRITTPTLHPIEIWQKTNRDKAFGQEMLVVEDHHGSAFVIGATAEGLMTELVKSARPSYRDLPIVVHQFVQKFRDEKRPRGGLLRVREFMMKDAYSFHATEQDLLKWYKIFYASYIKIAKRFDLTVIPVEADSGAIGGDYNHEFMIEAEAGEDTILLCEKCSYAVNEEKAESKFETYKQNESQRERVDVKGEGIIGVAALAKFLKISIQVTTKTLIYKTDDDRIVAAMIRGDYDINELKLKNYLQANSVELADEATVNRVTGAEVGYAGPINLPAGVTLVADLTCQSRINFETGANKTNYHALNVNFERDFPTPKFTDIRSARTGDRCPKCTGQLVAKKTIEWGHVFHQGQFYAKPHEAAYTDKDGELKTLWQGAYGIGVGRTMATIVEKYNDEKGIIWPRSVTPYQAHLIDLNKSDEQGQALCQALQTSGFEVLWDDRKGAAAGEKFTEADLIGICIRLVISPKTGTKIEWKERAGGEIELLSVDELILNLQEYYHQEIHA